MLSNISVPLLGLVDTAILGHLDDSRYLAAVAMGTSLFTFVFWSFAFLRMGTTALVAQHYRNPHGLTGVLQSAVLLAMAIGLLLLLLAPWLITLLLFLVDAVADISTLSHDYLSIRFYIAPVSLLNYVALGYLIGLGRTRATLVILVATNVLNGALNYGFVYGLHLNSNGVAYASNIAEIFQLMLAVLFIRPKLIDSTAFAFAKTQFTHFMQLNVQLFVRTFLLLFTFAFFMSKGAQHSAVLLSANAILINLLMFISNALDGFAVASESLVGKALADKKQSRIKAIIKASGQWSLFFALGFTLVLWVAHEPIVHLLTSQAPVLHLLAQLQYWLIFLPLAGFACYWLDGIFIGLAAGREMRDSVIFGLIFLFLPLQYAFDAWTYHGLWLALFAFLLGRAFWQLFTLPKIMQRNANYLT